MDVSLARGRLAPGGYIQAGLSSRISSSGIAQTGMPSPPRPPVSPLPRDRVPERAHMAACPSPSLRTLTSTPCAGWQTGRRRRFRRLAAEKASATPSPSTRRSTGSRGRLSYPQLTHTPPYPPMLPARRRRSRACLPRIPPCARPPAFACMFGGCTVSFVTRIVA